MTMQTIKCSYVAGFILYSQQSLCLTFIEQLSWSGIDTKQTACTNLEDKQFLDTHLLRLDMPT